LIIGGVPHLRVERRDEKAVAMREFLPKAEGERREAGSTDISVEEMDG